MQGAWAASEAELVADVEVIFGEGEGEQGAQVFVASDELLGGGFMEIAAPAVELEDAAGGGLNIAAEDEAETVGELFEGAGPRLTVGLG